MTTTQYSARKKATNPISAFYDSFTTDATFMAASLWIAPAPTTAVVVSMLPPIHAPATSGDGSMDLAAYG